MINASEVYAAEHDCHFPSMWQDESSHDDVGVLADEIRRRLLALGVDQAAIDGMQQDDLDDDDEPEQDAAAAGQAQQQQVGQQVVE